MLLELTKTPKGEKGYIVTCRIGTRYCNSFFSAPSKNISHADLQYIQERFPIISTEKRAERFKEHWKELFAK